MITAIIIAGGVGKRMGQDIPKQFITIEGKPIIIYTLESFLSKSITKISQASQLRITYNFSTVYSVIIQLCLKLSKVPLDLPYSVSNLYCLPPILFYVSKNGL